MRAHPGPAPRGAAGAVLTAVLLLSAGSAFGTTVSLADIDSGLTSPAGDYRWLNAADQPYAADYRESYDYTQASVQVTYDDLSSVLRGTLSAEDLKPNFAYQVKLTGTPDTPSCERIGLAGRWWQETWNGSAWADGTNLNNKGTGESPNPNDLVYFDRRDVPDASSPTGLHYRYTGYLVFDYFLTDDLGDASLAFEADDSYHVLWKTTQRVYDTGNDGPLKTAAFDPDPSNPAYDNDHDPASVTVFGEWERLPAGGVHLARGDYTCEMILTEESFHGSGGEYAGGWAAAMGGEVGFTIVKCADANGDGLVDGVDLAFWQENYDPVGLNDNNTFGIGDWSGDGLIDGVDLALWQENYDPLGPAGTPAAGAASAVPEPVTSALLGVAFTALALARRLKRKNR